MTALVGWVLAAGTGWIVVATLAALAIGRAIGLADREREAAQAARSALAREMAS